MENEQSGKKQVHSVESRQTCRCNERKTAKGCFREDSMKRALWTIGKGRAGSRDSIRLAYFGRVEKT